MSKPKYGEGLDACFNLESRTVIPSNHPKDMIFKMHMNAGTAAVSLPVRVGAKVFTMPLTEATVTEDSDGIPIIDVTGPIAILMQAIDQMSR